MSLRIVPESWGYADGIRAVHLAAFPTSAEADLVMRLQADLSSEISLVAKEGGRIVGHILLSRMEVEGDGRRYRALGLAPVAVVPERQRQGVGCALVEAALERAEALDEEILFVLGKPQYYGCFGFSAEAAAPFASPYAGPYFMARSLGAELPSLGTAAYAPAFAELS